MAKFSGVVDARDHAKKYVIVVRVMHIRRVLWRHRLALWLLRLAEQVSYAQVRVVDPDELRSIAKEIGADDE